MILNRSNILKSKLQPADTCLCKKEYELKHLTASFGCSEDLAAVSALPEQWVLRRSGPILSKYLKQCEQSHQNVMDDMLKDLKLVNEEINNKVRTLAEILSADIQQNQNDIDCVVEKCVSSENSLSTDDRTKALTQINIFLSRRIKGLTNFKLEALSLERDRTTAIKIKLQSYFQQLIAIGHRSPKELLHEFDEKIYDINQQLMSNSRTHMLLEIKLRSQADKCLVNARSALNQMSLVMSTFRRGRSARIWSREQKHFNRSASACVNRDSNTTDRHLSQHSDEIMTQTKLVDGYRNAIIKMFMGISHELDELYKEIGDHNIIARECSTPVITAIHKIIEKAHQSLGIMTAINKDSPHRDFIDISRSSISNMQKSVSSFGENLKDTYLILYNAGHLWDAHMIRLALAQKLIMATVEDLIVNNDAMQLSNEVVTDIAIEQLRAAPDADKLQQYFDVIGAALDRTTDLYKQHSEIEVGKLEEFTDISSSLINTLLAEFNYFLERNPRSILPEIKSPIKTPGTGSPGNTGLSGRLLVSKAIFQTEIQNVALCNWRNGFLESFEINMSVIPDQLNQQVQLWVEERIDILRIRHSLKLMSHSIRKERIQVARELRLAEIQFHETRLNSHLDAIYDLINDLPIEASEFMNLDSPELYPLTWWLSKIQSDMSELFARDPLDPEIKRLKMCSYASRLVKHRQLFSDSLNCAAEQYKKGIEYRFQVARISNVRFMSQLKLFSEGGRYSAPEALKTCTALLRGADALESCVNRTLDCVNHRRSQLLVLADQQIAPIQRIVDEVLKATQKGFLDKKKFAPPKK